MVGRTVSTVFVLRSQYVILQKVIGDADLAELYGVATKRLNKQARRNRERFPEDSMFQLTSDQKAEVVANCDHLARLGLSPTDRVSRDLEDAATKTDGGKLTRLDLALDGWGAIRFSGG